MQKKKKTMLRMMITAAAVFLLAAAGYLLTTGGIVRAGAYDVLTEVHRHAAATLERSIQGDFNDLHSIADAIAFSGEELFSANTLDYLREEAEVRREILHLAVADRAGNVRTTDGYDAYQEIPESHRAALRGEDYLSDPVESAVGDHITVIHLAVPVRRDGAVIGVLTCVYAAENCKTLLPVSPYGSEGAVCIIKATGEAVLLPDSAGRARLPEFSFHKGFSEEQSLTGELKVLPAALSSGESGSVPYRMGGEDGFLTYTPLGQRDWYLVSAVSAAPVTAKLQQLRILSCVVLLSALVLCIGILSTIYLRCRKSQGELERLASLDVETGLPMGGELERYFAAMPRRQGWGCVVVKLNRVPLLHDLFGQRSAEDLQRRVAQRLREFVGDVGFVCVMPDDCFCLLTDIRGTPSNLLNELRIMNQQIEMLQVQARGEKFNFHCTCFCKAWILRETDDSLDAVLSVLKLGIPHGSGESSSCSLVEESERESRMRQVKLLGQVDEAFTQRQFTPVFQPQYDLRTKRVVGAEILARWQHPELGLLTPGDFMPPLETSGRSLDLDLYMLEEACKAVRQWTDAEMLPVPVTVNISPMSIYKPDFAKDVVQVIRSYQIPPILIVLEMSEAAAVENSSEEMRSAIQQFKEVGVLLSMDDFGRGRSSLLLLPELSIDILKLGPAFFGGGDLEPRSRTMLNSVVSMAQGLKMQVVAQNVETEEQARLLKEIGCYAAQGYLYSRPLSGEEFEELIF